MYLLYVGGRDGAAYSPEKGTGLYCLHIPHHRGRQAFFQGELVLGDTRRKEAQPPQLV